MALLGAVQMGPSGSSKTTLLGKDSPKSLQKVQSILMHAGPEVLEQPDLHGSGCAKSR